MKTIIQFSFFFFLLNVCSAQTTIIKNKKISKITEYRERFYPNIIKRELYDSVLFNKAGNIVLRFNKSNNPTPLDNYFYDDSGKLVKYIRHKADTSIYDISWEWKTNADNFSRKGYTPEFIFLPIQHNWPESFNRWIELAKKHNYKINIDTTIINGKSLKKIIRIIAVRNNIIDTINYYFEKNLKKEEHIRNVSGKNSWRHILEFNSKGKLIEEYPVYLNDKNPYHFFYEYYKNGLIKKMTSKIDGTGMIAEVSEIFYEYYDN